MKSSIIEFNNISKQMIQNLTAFYIIFSFHCVQMCYKTVPIDRILVNILPTLISI